jgi:hypothetical protein
VYDPPEQRGKRDHDLNTERAQFSTSDRFSIKGAQFNKEYPEFIVLAMGAGIYWSLNELDPYVIINWSNAK